MDKLPNNTPSHITVARNGIVRRKAHPRVRPLGKPERIGTVERREGGWSAFPAWGAVPQLGPFKLRGEAINALVDHIEGKKGEG